MASLFFSIGLLLHASFNGFAVMIDPTSKLIDQNCIDYAPDCASILSLSSVSVGFVAGVSGCMSAIGKRAVNRTLSAIAVILALGASAIWFSWMCLEEYPWDVLTGGFAFFQHLAWLILMLGYACCMGAHYRTFDSSSQDADTWVRFAFAISVWLYSLSNAIYYWSAQNSKRFVNDVEFIVMIIAFVLHMLGTTTALLAWHLDRLGSQSTATSASEELAGTAHAVALVCLCSGCVCELVSVCMVAETYVDVSHVWEVNDAGSETADLSHHGSAIAVFFSFASIPFPMLFLALYPLWDRTWLHPQWSDDEEAPIVSAVSPEEGGRPKLKRTRSVIKSYHAIKPVDIPLSGLGQAAQKD